MTNRLPPQPGEWIDRQEVIDFHFEGQLYHGHAGDTLATALWSHDVRTVARSFKYHRPRGIYSLANHDANFIVEDETQTNLRGDVLPLSPGLDVRAVNTRGGVIRDKLRITESFSRLLPVGFYYKAFHTPRRLFPFYERQMRQVAGLGKVKPNRTTRSTPKDYAFCDTLVVGAGPAGLSAAVAAADAGSQVVLVDELPRLGGSLAWQWTQDNEAQAQYQALLRQVADHSRIQVRTSTQAAGWYTDHWVALVDQQRLTKLRAKSLVVASGCYEQPAVFQNNDLPGIMLGSAAQRLVHLYAVRPCAAAAVLVANEEGYRVACDMIAAGVTVNAVIDLRPDGVPPTTAQLPDSVPWLSGHTIVAAVASGRNGKSPISGVQIAPLSTTGTWSSDQTQFIACDGVLVSVGWAPCGDILYQTGTKFSYNDTLEQLVPASLAPGVFAAGRVRGVFDWRDQIADGQHAGQAAAASLNMLSADPAPSIPNSQSAHSHPYPIVSHPKKKNFVDFDEDLHLSDFAHSHQEGYDNIELLKRYSTVGMGPSQGKLSNMNAVRILARLNDKSVNETGTTTSRPFHHPVSIEVLAGRRFHPERRTPLHHWHVDNQAALVHVGGGWLRPEYYRKTTQTREQSILDEALHVRHQAGLIDLGTLTKIHVGGPDCVEFLHRIYTGSFRRQRVDTLRYGLACDETGVIIDDGIVARLADRQFYLSATTTGGGSFFREMQRWAILWNLQVELVNLTGQYTAMNLAGPQCREVLSGLTNGDVSSEALPFSGVRQMHVAGIPARVLRVGFIGELGYEIHVPAAHGQTVWNALMDSGQSVDLRPFGVEAQRLLRLEKGHLIVGQDTDALTTPREVNLDALIHAKKPFFVGKRSLQINDRKPLTRKLVGFQFSPQFQGQLPLECNLVVDEEGEIAGRITSIAHHSTLGMPLGLAFVTPQLAKPGTSLNIRTDDGRLAPCQVTTTPFYDPQGERQQL
ncbi:MAG: 2Fe-2S iron-sulfur cluster-binding protein [Pirellulaceae bacterium]|nr:2Fe-2S iron-sulfur cluster-binding protein [Pirellulaceae bacterium]